MVDGGGRSEDDAPKAANAFVPCPHHATAPCPAQHKWPQDRVHEFTSYANDVY